MERIFQEVAAGSKRKREEGSKRKQINCKRRQNATILPRARVRKTEGAVRRKGKGRRDLQEKAQKRQK